MSKTVERTPKIMKKDTQGPRKRPVFTTAPENNNQDIPATTKEVELQPQAVVAAGLMLSSLSKEKTSEDTSKIDLETEEEYWASLLQEAPDEEDFYYSSMAQENSQPIPPTPDDLIGVSSADHVLSTIRLIVAAQNGAAVETASLFFSQIRGAESVLSRLPDLKQPIWIGLLELLEIDSANRKGSRVDLHYLPLANSYDVLVQSELNLVSQISLREDLPEPESTWFALVEYVQRTLSKTTAKRYLDALEKKDTVDSLVKLHRKIQPPTTKRDLFARQKLATARTVLEESRAAKALAPVNRLSFGLPTLDRALTNPTSREPIGSIGLGEQMVIAGPTGTGKTSMFYTILASLVQDLVNQGKRDARVIALHTEETSEDKLRGAGFGEKQRNHHLIDNLVIENIGSSRKRIVEVIYDVVIDAIERSRATGRPVMDFAPYVFLLDYIQEINEPGENEVTSTLATAQLIKNGVQELNPEELAKYSGVVFSSYAGMPWPEELRSHRIAVVTFAQLRKLEDSELYYRADNKRLPVADFAIEDTRPGLKDHTFQGDLTECSSCSEVRVAHPKWIGPDGSPYHWQVRDGDLRILKQNQIRGHGMILQAATTIVFLHRSQPRNNPAITKPNGRRGLTDTRARLILDKTRTGSSLVYVPLAFDLTVDGHRARFYDEIAQIGLDRGLIKVDTSVYTHVGDPMLPPRAIVSPLSGIKY